MLDREALGPLVWKTCGQGISIARTKTGDVFVTLLQELTEKARRATVCQLAHTRVHIGGNEWFCVEEGCHRVTWTSLDDEDDL